MSASSLLQILNYSVPGNFSYDLSLIEFVGVRAMLKLLTAPEVFTQPFTSATGFTYDSSKSEFIGGVLRQKDQRPTGAIFAANFNLGLNSNWDNLVPTLIGTPSIVAGKLDCLGAEANTTARYSSASVGSIGNKITVRTKFTPNYSGTPAVNSNIFSIEDPAATTTINHILLMHSASGGTIRMRLGDSAGVVVVDVGTSNGILSAWSPTAGTEYEIEFNLDTDLGQMHLFIDGVLHTAKLAIPVYSRSSTATRLNIGGGTNYPACDSKYDDFIIFNNIQHTAGYTPGYSVSDYIYMETAATLPTFAHALLGTFLSYTSLGVTEVGAPRYAIKTGVGSSKYWNGSAWVISDGSYAQSNSLSTINANIATLSDANGATSATVGVMFQSANALASVDDLVFTVLAHTNYPTTNPTVVNNSGVLADALESFEQTVAAIPAGTAIKYVIRVNEQDKYWTGTAWANSSGYTQSNTAAEISANVGTLDISSGVTLKLKAYLHSDTGAAKPELETVTIGYNFFNTLSEPPTCTVWGFYRDLSGKGIEGATVTFSLKRTSKQYREAGSSIIEKPVSVQTDANGRFECDLVRSSSFETEGQYEVKITKEDDLLNTSVTTKTTPIRFSVPDASNVNITSLISTVA